MTVRSRADDPDHAVGYQEIPLLPAANYRTFSRCEFLMSKSRSDMRIHNFIKKFEKFENFHLTNGYLLDELV